MLSLTRWAAAVARDNGLTAEQIRQEKKPQKETKKNDTTRSTKTHRKKTVLG